MNLLAPLPEEGPEILSSIEIFKRFYGYYAPVEEALQEFLTLASGSKEQDLPNDDFSEVGHYEDVLGVKFILEKRSLGRRFLRSPVSIYRSYGDQIQNMWKHFQGELLFQCVHTGEEEGAIEDAIGVFDDLEEWILNQQLTKVPLRFSDCP